MKSRGLFESSFTQLKSGICMRHLICTAVTEVPRLEEWFLTNTHPSQALIARYTDDLNSQPYRLKFPRLEQKNIQFWFKNRRVFHIRCFSSTAQSLLQGWATRSLTRADSAKGIICPEHCNLTNKNLVFGII